MNNIDILEDFLDYYSFLKTAIGGDDIREFEIKISKNEIKAISNLISENKELKEENKKLNIIRLELLLSQFPDSTETYKKYKVELQSLLGKE